MICLPNLKWLTTHENSITLFDTQVYFIHPQSKKAAMKWCFYSSSILYSSVICQPLSDDPLGPFIVYNYINIRACTM